MYGHFLRCMIHNDTIINGTVAVLLLHGKIEVTVKIHIFTGFLKYCDNKNKYNKKKILDVLITVCYVLLCCQLATNGKIF